jgi:hypothetical protein
MAHNKPVIHILSGNFLLTYVKIYKNNNKLSAAQIIIIIIIIRGATALTNLGRLSSRR